MMTGNSKYEYWHNLSKEERESNIRWKFYGDQSDDDEEYLPQNALDCIPILDHGYVALLDHMGTDIDIVNAARKSFNRESSFFDDKDRKLLKYLWKHNHTSPFEMVELKFAVMAPMFVARQWMRHRTWSYNEVSRRYTEDRLRFYTPKSEFLRRQSPIDRQASVEWFDFGYESFLCSDGMVGNAEICEKQYHELLKLGLCREQARMVLPQSLYVEFIAKVNLSNLLHFLKLRLDKHAQWEIQQYAEAIVEMLENIVPETMKIFKDNNNETFGKNDKIDQQN